MLIPDCRKAEVSERVLKPVGLGARTAGMLSRLGGATGLFVSISACPVAEGKGAPVAELEDGSYCTDVLPGSLMLGSWEECLGSANASLLEGCKIQTR